VFASVRKQSDGDALLKQHDATDAKTELVPVIVDVTKALTISRAVTTVKKTLKADDGKAVLVGLVNNAGVNVGGPVEFVPVKDLAWCLDVNVTGQVRVIQALLPLLRAEHGRIVNVTSVNGFLTVPFQGAYCASKAAFEAVSDALRMELAPWRMSVSVIEPGYVATKILEKANDNFASALERLPAGCAEHYGPYYGKSKPVPKKLLATAKVTNDAIWHALTSSTPKTRYTVGSPAFLSKIRGVQLVPDRFRDKSLERIWPARFKVGDRYASASDSKSESKSD
jgi:NAD(P)-dependent dehydrogenase (short-subunit alcohol dehydrogenase family)